MKLICQNIVSGILTRVGKIKSACTGFLFTFLAVKGPVTIAQPVLFDFDNAPLYSSLPISQTAGGITAQFSATGQGYSIQDANVMGFTPPGFSGRILYPNSVFLADLHIRFDQPLLSFSILYSCQELGCDDAATMRVTAYRNGNPEGTNTRTATYPGTWPVDTLSCFFPQGFDSVIIHYDSPPPTCQDYGVIYLADNMIVTALNTASNERMNHLRQLTVTNPVYDRAIISFFLDAPENLNIAVFDAAGRTAVVLSDGRLCYGKHEIYWDTPDALARGLYFVTLRGSIFPTM